MPMWYVGVRKVGTDDSEIFTVPAENDYRAVMKVGSILMRTRNAQVGDYVTESINRVSQERPCCV